jgi:cytochrome c biogenesis protein CcdA
MDIRLDLIGWSFGAGIFAFFNPCGFAMLPAYVAHYLGREEEGHWTLLRAFVKGLSLGSVVSAGFVTVFAVLGGIVSLVGGAIGATLPWVGALIGLGLLGLGVSMLLGKAISLPALERLGGKIAQARGNPGQRDLPFYYLYGMTYALASTSCTLPVFIIVVGNAFAGGVLNGFVQFGAYTLGMALMMIALSVVMAFSKELVISFMPQLMRAMRWIGGLGVIAAGAYLVYYNLIYSGTLAL